MKFSEALEECMKGKKIRNGRWNGKNAYVFYTPGRKIPAKDWVVRAPGTELTDGERLRGEVEVIGHLDMVTNDGKRIIGWLASQYDMMSEDWEVLE